jgi:hypothetical protein
MAARQSEFIPPASPAPSEKPGARKTSWDSAIFDAGFPGRKATNYGQSKAPCISTACISSGAGIATAAGREAPESRDRLTIQ